MKDKKEIGVEGGVMEVRRMGTKGRDEEIIWANLENG